MLRKFILAIFYKLEKFHVTEVFVLRCDINLGFF